ncbi:MAG TPA: RDD family protein [Thermoguttaceae bacterium]|nr:RDD family protein [Thermoguttaceae bacterium]
MGTCPLCHGDMPASKPPRLYGNPVCRKCYWGFAGRRYLAFFLDSILFIVFMHIVAFVIVTALTIGDSPDRVWSIMDGILMIGGAVLFLCKDGFSGYSLGKRLVGIRVVHSKTGQPSWFFASFIRNLPLCILIVPVIVAVQLPKGERAGDSTAHTLVMWDAYADAFIFPEEPLVTAELASPFAMPNITPVIEDGNPYRSPMN